MSKTVLIIGAHGYIGSKLMQDLDSQYLLTGVDIGWFGIDSGIIKIDYRDLTKDFLSRFDVVILLAGHSSVKMSEADLKEVWQNNVNNFLSLNNKLSPDQKLIYASSGSVYGQRETINFENDIINFDPINNYDITKYSLDIHAQNLISQGRKLYGLRFGTVNGNSPVLRTELMINSMTLAAMSTGKISVINPGIIRPILWIDDVVFAIKKIIDHNGASGIYNLSSFTLSVGEIAASVSQSTGADIITQHTNNIGYSFDMSTQKFSNEFDFKFSGTPTDIVKSVIRNIDRCEKTNRNSIIRYQP